ncbi:Threonine efflux protein [Corynebacterium kalinowskii]|uniref:Threonine efflux protein n=1 Tax=Corynebacterium kalinowskii TaxID=2675216 RepID=A0A6B8VNY5_9CORY|nr:LysE family translocator [Corynebacterium kalinowskii]QGU01501.1 Threonine efflux protein [Corynebacterium kalinowskii]
MTLAQLGTIIALNLAGMYTPGPDFFLLLRLAARSRRHALAAVAGIATGILVWVTLTVLGTAALFVTNPALLGWVQLLGGSWLLYMGFSMVRSGWEQRVNRVVLAEIPTDQLLGSMGKNYRLGLMTNLANPKAVLFFASIMAPFMPTDPTWLTSLEIIVALVLCTFIGFSLLVFVVSASVVRKRLVAAGPWIDIIAGVLFLAVGGWMVYEGLHAV